MKWPMDIYDLIFLSGVAAIVYGLALIFIPAAWIAGGIGMIAASLAGGARKGAARAFETTMSEQEADAS